MKPLSSNQIDIMVVSFTGDTGLSDYSASLCRELCKISRIELVTAKSFDEHKYCANYLVTKLFRRTRHFPIDFFKFAMYVLRKRPKVVLFQSWLKYPGFELLLVLVLRVFSIRVALTIHDLLPHYPKPWSRWECAHYYSMFDSLIVHSERQLSALHDMGVKRNTLVVPHGIYDIFNTENLTKAQGRNFFASIKRTDFVVLFFGNLDERKGFVQYIESARLLEQESRIKFMVAGRSDGRSLVCSALNEGRHLSNTLIHDFSIPHSHVQNYFSACDVVALPYLEGTTSGVFKLAMAFNKPVLCTDKGDFRESLANWSGLIIDHRDIAESLVEGVLKLRDNYDDYLTATTRLSSNFKWPVIAERYKLHVMGLVTNGD
jgi:glycosyltransferase involved in cell wall biosynthesis